MVFKKNSFQQHGVRHRISSAYIKTALWLVCIAGVLITVGTLAIILHFEQQKRQDKLEQWAHTMGHELESLLNASDPLLAALSSYCAKSPEVDPDIFKAMAELAVKHYPYVHALEWVPRLEHPQRQQFESDAQRVHPGYAITQRNAQGDLVPADRRNVYYPVLYAVPGPSNANAVGFDLASNAKRLGTMEEAVERKALTVSPRVSLVQDAVKNNGVLLFYPVYPQGANAPVFPSAAPRGFVLAVFKLSELMQGLVQEASSQGLKFQIFDSRAPAEDALIFDSQHPGPELAGARPHGNALTVKAAVSIGGRDWEVQFGEWQAVPWWHMRANAWVTLFSGLAVTAALTAYLMFWYRRQKDYELSRERLLEKYPRNASYLAPWEWRIRQDVMLLSPEAMRILGLEGDSDAIRFSRYLALIPEPDRQHVEHQVHAALFKGTPFKVEHQVITPAGDVRHVQCEGLIEGHGRKGMTKVFGMLADVTQVKAAEDKVVENERRMRWVMSATGEGIWDWNIATGAVFHNRNWHEQLGYKADEAPQSIDGFQKVLHPDDKALVMERLQTALGSGTDYQSEHRLVCKDGTPMWVVDRGRVVERDSSGQPLRMVGAYIDVTQKKRNEQTIENLAFYDPLTGLANRRLLEIDLKKTITRRSRVGGLGLLIFIDLDDFKMLNDTQGHDVGDLLLQAFGRLLTGLVRESDTVARVGGDEFVILVDEAGSDAASATEAGARIASKILAGVNVPFDLNGYHYRTTTSIGLTTFGAPGDSAQEALKRADLSMYQAKQAGKNTYRFFDPQSQRLMDLQAATELELKEALTAGQFESVYQPIWEADGRMVGAEALCRWRHPVRGLLSPKDFIAVAEKNGLIVQIDEIMLQQTCEQLALWRDDPARRHLVLSVNVSARFFGFSDFIEKLLALCDRYQTPRDRLKIELTESMLLKNVSDAATKVSRLAECGIRLSLDDFGTGYSSLTYLQHLRIHEIKIDQSFVRQLETDHHAQAICRSVLALAQSLQLSVIAEGVETAAQRDFLLDHGCKLFQGYMGGPPCTASELLAS